MISWLEQFLQQQLGIACYKAEINTFPLSIFRRNFYIHIQSERLLLSSGHYDLHYIILINNNNFK